MIILCAIYFRLSVLGSIGNVECIFLFVILHRKDITRRHLQLIVCDSPSKSCLFSQFNLFFTQHPKFIQTSKVIMGNGQVVLRTARQVVVECILYVHAVRGHLADF